MAGAADDQGLAAPFRHEVHPCGFVGPVVTVEVSEFAQVMDFQPVGGLAELALPGQQPVDEPCRCGPRSIRRDCESRRINMYG